MIVSEGRGEGESGCEGVRVWGAAHLVRLAPALAVGAKAAAAGILGLLERRRIRRELAATIGSMVLQHMDPPCALRRERGALYHLVLPVVLGQELDIFCGIAISLPSRRLGLAGLTGTAAGAGGGVHSSGSSGSESPQNCFICLASVPTRERAPPSGIWQKSHASFRLRWPLAISSAAATDRRECRARQRLGFARSRPDRPARRATSVRLQAAAAQSGGGEWAAADGGRCSPPHVQADGRNVVLGTGRFR